MERPVRWWQAPATWSSPSRVALRRCWSARRKSPRRHRCHRVRRPTPWCVGSEWRVTR